MSYSFSVQASDKASAIQAVSASFDEVVTSQPVHAVDKEAAVASATAYINLLADPSDTEVVDVQVNGWLSWVSDGVYSGASVGVTARIIEAPAQEA